MSLAITYSRAHVGIDAPLVTVETHLTNGLPALTMVGLPETAVRESKDRVRSALINAGFEFPNRRITINLAPADLPKEGGRFDLAIAMGLLAASNQVPKAAMTDYEFVAELALAGHLRPSPASLSASLATRSAKRCLVVAPENSLEALMPDQAQVLAPAHLNQLCEWIIHPERASSPSQQRFVTTMVRPELADVHGQLEAKRALEIAAAGQHNLLMCGPPGTGKTMLAERLQGLLPPLTEQQSLEAGIIASSLGCFDPATWDQPPWRAPHHSASAVALVGGGRIPRPGEISRAHQGVLFLDELAEFPRAVLDVLRQPLEHGRVEISRANHQTTLPANFLLVAAMNPCPCGYYGSSKQRCRCSANTVERYLQRLSGPLLDRIDLQVEVSDPAEPVLFDYGSGETSAIVARRVLQARQRQWQRSQCLNGRLDVPALIRQAYLNPRQRKLLQEYGSKLGFSARATHKILRIARTIADLEGCDNITDHHLREALSYRRLERLRQSLE